MSGKMQKYIPAIRPAVAIPIELLATVAWAVVMAATTNFWVDFASCVLFVAFCCVLISSIDKYRDQLALQISNAKEVEPPTRLAADDSPTVKWACRVWHEVTTMRKPLELNWNQIYELESKLGKAEKVRLSLKGIRADIAGATGEDIVDVSNSDRYPVSHDHAVELRNREASKWRDGSDWEYGKFRNKYDEGVIEAIADDDVINGSYTLANEYLDALNTQEVDEMRGRIANRVQTIVDEYRRTRREGAKAYMGTIFKEE